MDITYSSDSFMACFFCVCIVSCPMGRKQATRKPILKKWQGRLSGPGEIY